MGMMTETAIEKWLDREQQYTPDGFFIWACDDQLVRREALRNALYVIGENAGSHIGADVWKACGPQEIAGDDYFGVCPHCHKHDGMINIGREHWYYCKEHKVTWCGGANLFSGWKEQTEDEQRKIFDDLGFGEFQTVESTTHAKEFERHVIDDDIPF